MTSHGPGPGARPVSRRGVLTGALRAGVAAAAAVGVARVAGRDGRVIADFGQDGRGGRRHRPPGGPARSSAVER